jgi:cytochrome c oxidase subunit 2
VGHRLLPVRRRRALALAALLAAVGSLALAGVASADIFTPEDGGSPNADDIDTLYKLVLAVGVVVFIGVEGTLLYALWKFRAHKGAVASQIRGNTRLEIGWTVGAAVILVFLAVFTFVQLDGIRNPPNSDDAISNQTAGAEEFTAQSPPQPDQGPTLDITVNGQQYQWRYTYPDGDENPLNNPYSYEELIVPTGVTVRLDIEAQDVAHSWWIPALGGKMDALPGHTNYTWLKVPRGQEGEVFTGQCAELCGRNHANMIASVRAVSPRDFEEYLRRKTQEINDANRAVEELRPQVEGRQDRGTETP